MAEEAKRFLLDYPDYEAVDGLDVDFDEVELNHKNRDNCYARYFEVLELELYDTVKEAKGEA